MPFPAHEKQVLLAVKGVGPTVVARLEQLGFASLAALAQADALHIVTGAAAAVGSTCWKNSPQARAAITGAIEAAQRHLARPVPTGAAVPPASTPPLAAADLPNLGPKSRQWLAQAGIATVEQLRHLGAPAAYVQVKRSGIPVSLNLLWALEGALTGLPWQAVARQHRTSLLLAVEQLERGHPAPPPSR